MKRYFFSFVFLLLFFCINVYAEEDTTCNYNSQAELSKLAYQVSVSYDIKNNGQQNVIEIKIYNIVDGIYVEFKDENDTTQFVFPEDTQNGTYKFETTNITDIFEYNFEVKSVKYGCEDKTFRKLSLVKPKRNSYFDDKICKYDSTIDYYYCQEWITTDFKMSDEEIREKINEHLVDYKNNIKIETKKEYKENEKIKKMKQIAIIVLIVAIVLDLIIIIKNIINAKRSHIYD